MGRADVYELTRLVSLDALGREDLGEGAFDDWDFWLSMLEGPFRGTVLREPLLRHRVRTGSRYHRGIQPDIYRDTLLLQYSLREALATAQALWELHITHPQPMFLGPFEGIMHTPPETPLASS